MDLGNLIFMSNNCNRPSGSEGGAASIKPSAAEGGGGGGSLPLHNPNNFYTSKITSLESPKRFARFARSPLFVSATLLSPLMLA